MLRLLPFLFGCFSQFISNIVKLVYQRIDLSISSTFLCKAVFDRHFFYSIVIALYWSSTDQRQSIWINQQPSLDIDWFGFVDYNRLVRPASQWTYHQNSSFQNKEKNKKMWNVFVFSGSGGQVYFHPRYVRLNKQHKQKQRQYETLTN